MDSHTHELGWEWEYDFPLRGSTYGYPYGDPYSHSHPNLMGMGYVYGYPHGDSHRNPVGMGMEIPFPRQP